MTTAELIRRLQKLLVEHGNYQVVISCTKPTKDAPKSIQEQPTVISMPTTVICEEVEYPDQTVKEICISD
jgi:hypothetical protein